MIERHTCFGLFIDSRSIKSGPVESSGHSVQGATGASEARLGEGEGEDTGDSLPMSLVSWCLTYPYGGIGMMHTMEVSRLVE